MNRIITWVIALFSPSIIYAAKPTPWQLGFQPAATPVMEKIESMYYFMLVILTFVVIFVVGLLAYTLWRFSAKNNPIPDKFTHNVAIEIIWTVIPVILLIIIAVPTFKSIYYVNQTPKAEFTIKVSAYQWYWHYEYPDHGGFGFDSYMVADKDLQEGQLRLLDVDNRIYIPENTVVRFLITSGDVIHSFAVPAFGIKVDAVPGRINETWVKVGNRGVYYGQCSELCGANHAFMPIAVQVISKNDFEKWVTMAQKKFAYSFINKAPQELQTSKYHTNHPKYQFNKMLSYYVK